jgi:tryptophan-rich sensory protein
VARGGASKTNTWLTASSSSEEEEAAAVRLSDNNTGTKLDTDAVVKYAVALVVQMSLFTGLFAGLDALVNVSGINPASIPRVAVGFLFYVFSLKSRVLNPLNNNRPKRPTLMQGGTNTTDASPGFRDRNMPSWTPPGVVFPIMWVLIIGPIRAVAAAWVWSLEGHTFCHVALLSFVLHLTCGDIWNTINNTERRYGASVVAVIVGVLGSLVHAAYQYYQVAPGAGKLLGLTGVWLVVASTLIFDTWRINPISTEPLQRDALYPVVSDTTQTKFSWFQPKP